MHSQRKSKVQKVLPSVKCLSGSVIKEPEPLPLKPHDPAYAIHHPFGRPGAGAPLRDREGNLQTVVAGKVSKEVNNEVEHTALSTQLKLHIHFSFFNGQDFMILALNMIKVRLSERETIFSLHRWFFLFFSRFHQPTSERNKPNNSTCTISVCTIVIFLIFLKH